MNFVDYFPYIFAGIELICFVTHLIISILTKRSVTSLHSHSEECPNTYSVFATSFYKAHSSKKELYLYTALFTLCPNSIDIPSSDIAPFDTFLAAVQSYCHDNDCVYSPSVVECLYSATRDVYLKGVKK